MDPSGAFLRFQPFCVAVCKERDAESLNALTGAIDRMNDDETLQSLQDYVLYPLKLILKLREQRHVKNTGNADRDGPGHTRNIPKDSTVEATIRCLRVVLKRTAVNGVATAVDLFTLLLSILGHPRNGGRVDAGISEDLMEVVVGAVESLIKSCDDDVGRQLCTVDFLPLWGHAVATFLSLAENEVCINVVVASLKTLVAFEEVLPADEAGVCFATFFPGIVVSCLKLATRDEKQNHRINCEALRLLTKSVSLVLRNKGERKADGEKARVWETLNQSTSSSSKSGLLVEPTAEWRRNTWEKLGVVVNKLSQSASSNHPHWKVRLESLALVQTVVAECDREDYEKHCSNAFVEVTVSRLDDENAEVKRLAEKVLDQLRSLGSDHDGGSKLLREAAAASLQRATRDLPKVFNGQAGDREKLRLIRAVKGFIEVLGREGVMTALMTPSGSVNKLLLAFMQILEMDVDDLRIVQRLPSNALNALDDAYEGFKPKIRFRSFNDDRVLTGIEECLRTLGRLAKDNLYALCDYLVEYLEARNNDAEIDVGTDEDNDVEGSFYSKQMIFMLNQILVGAASSLKKTKRKTSTNVTSFVKETLLPLFLSNSLLHARCEALEADERTPASSNSRFLIDSTPSPLIQELHSSLVATNSLSKNLPRFNSNVFLVVLSLEGVSLCAKAAKTAFRPMLIKALYPVVEKVASELTMIQDAAYSALREMAVGCGYPSVGELLLSNSDYVINQLRSALRHGFMFGKKGAFSSNAPRVLAAMLKNAGPELLPLLKDTVEEAFLCLDTTGAYQPKRTKAFLKVLSALVFYVNQWFSASEDGAKDDRNSMPDPEYTREYWEEYAKNLRTVETLNGDGDGDGDGDEDLEALIEEGADDRHEAEEPAAEDPPPPYHVRVTEEIMTRCIYYLPDEDPRVRVLVLDVMRNCCETLSTHENTLLPLAHKCWSSFVCRLKDKDRHVVLKAFETLVVLSRTCGDFLLQRFSKDVLPALTTYMAAQGLVSAGLATAGSRPSLGFWSKGEGERDDRRRIMGDDIGSGRAYKFTIAFKLQLAVLKGIGPLCQAIKVKVETGLDKIVDFLLLHLRPSQPIELQDAAKDALLALGTVDADLLWMRISAARGDFSEEKFRRNPADDDDRLSMTAARRRRVAEGLSFDVLTEIIEGLSSDDVGS